MVICAACICAGAEMRTWTLADGRKYTAEFVHVMGGYVVLRNASGRNEKIKLADLSSEDRIFVELSNPPRLEISFRRKSDQKRFSPRFTTTLLPEIQINTFGGRIRQRSAGSYNHELHVEFFAIGKERAGKRFILLDRQEGSFFLTKENQRSHEFWGRDIELDEYEIFYIDRPRGKKYAGHLIIVADSRNKVIATKASHDWLLENLENLKQIPVGGYMDDACVRTFPTRPKPCRY